ncbi:PREDICTED: cytosolic sulfotransferase 5-like [Tarenaya hassleriana]|uniref:cytosolic sulfotransferase 5-like n=1 Tax=Tarenaya hassleriana TaxID=28532 RepID=UPI00053C1587|nr:PREDICTED: cytosolic sulfotransferase 5-like [Tarenaya hassleriana]
MEVKWWVDGRRIKHRGFWFKPDFIKASEEIQAHFTPLSSDIILSSFPKTGTTWLKALTTSILRHSSSSSNSGTKDCVSYREHNDDDDDDDDDVLGALNPHQVIPFLEIETFGQSPTRDIAKIPSPRVFNTHLPLSFLPEAVKTSGCRIIYITRNPADTFVSLWHWYKYRFGTQISIQEAFEEFCEGLVPAGPYFEHVLEFWVGSRDVRTRDRILFVTYEDLKEKPEENVKRMAEFLGCLKVKEDSDGEVEKIVRECSFERLSKVEVNKGKGQEEEEEHWSGTKFGMFFRRGVVGDWKNHLTQEMMKKLQEIAEVKWAASGLDLDIFTR